LINNYFAPNYNLLSMNIDLSLMISKKVSTMNESATIKMAQKARELAAKGIDVISLTLGEPDFDTPDYIKDKATEGLQNGHTKYTPVPGTMEIRKAICKKLKDENQLDYSPTNIVVSTGAKQTLMNVFMSILNPGDEVVIYAPYWVTYYEQVKFCDALPVVIRAGIDQDFKASVDQLHEAISPRTRAVIFSSPCNPTGSVFSQHELQAIADCVKEHDNLIVISDEIYEYINFTGNGHKSIAQLSGMKERTAVINGFSKGFAMTGWRLGYLAGPDWLAKACTKVQGQVTSGTTAFGQYAAAYAIANDKVETYKMVDEFNKRRALMIKLFSDIPGFKVNQPDGAFYLFPDVTAYFGKTNGHKTINNANDLVEILLEDAHVGTVSGSAFGNDDCIRMSYAASETKLKQAAERIKTVLSQYN
jgi:aspartate aminotransferase